MLNLKMGFFSERRKHQMVIVRSNEFNIASEEIKVLFFQKKKSYLKVISMKSKGPANFLSNHKSEVVNYTFQ